MRTDDLRIQKIHPLISPAVLEDECPATDQHSIVVSEARESVKSIISGSDPRLMVVVGPCSVHDRDALLDYAERLKPVADAVSSRIYCVLRVYFEKPRTVVGWKGLINDPDLDGSHQINKGLRIARELLARVTELGLPAGTEFLDATFGQYFTDLVSWGAIGARTVESQIHRQLASALSMPVGIKNRTDGDVQVAVDAICAARHRHLFPTISKEGSPVILETSGNEDCHLVLRGGVKPNYAPEDTAQAAALLNSAGLEPAIMVDCSHANSEKQPQNQPKVARAVVDQISGGNKTLRGIMLESNIEAGRQNLGGDLVYGKSVTDACLGFEETRDLLLDLAELL